MNNNGQHDGNGKIVGFPSRAERDRKRRAENRRNRPPREPLVNLPPATKALAASFLVLHVVLYFLPAPERFQVLETFGFMPGRYTGAAPFVWTALLAPFTYMFLHGGWSHLLVNTVMTAAFGTGAERLMGGKRMIVFFTLCSLTAALIHFAAGPSSVDPVVGASGGLSGLFAALLVAMQKAGGAGNGRYGLWPFVILWIGISFLFGQMEAPGGGTVAWVAHVGGFLAGFVFLKPVMKGMK